MLNIKAKYWNLNALLLTLSLFAYIIISYFCSRTDAPQILGLYSLLFVLYLSTYYLSDTDLKINQAVNFSIAFRISLLFLVPNLSDDFYRFIWDGRLFNAGINPFEQLPTFYINHPEAAPPGINQELFDKLNSKEYFTIYPPVNQLAFIIATWISSTVQGAAIVMRLFIIAAEIGSLYVIKRLLKAYHLPAKNILFYALNPLVILELTGSLHFEAIAIFFVLLSVYLLKKRRSIFSALSFALSVCTKLNPLIFLPLMATRLSFSKTLKYYLFTALFIVMFFMPLYDIHFIKGITSSFSLYFQKFEFNASIYYLIRAVGYYVKGYNIIGTAGKFLALTTIVVILLYTFFEWRKHRVNAPYQSKRNGNLLVSFLWIYFMYLVFSTTLHPWYVTPLVACSLFSRYRFPILWSGLIFFTYLNYYNEVYHEYIGIVIAEYVIVYAFMIYELFYKSEELEFVNEE